MTWVRFTGLFYDCFSPVRNTVCCPWTRGTKLKFSPDDFLRRDCCPINNFQMFCGRMYNISKHLQWVEQRKVAQQLRFLSTIGSTPWAATAEPGYSSPLHSSPNWSKDENGCLVEAFWKETLPKMLTLKHFTLWSISANGNMLALKIQRKWKLLKSVLNFLWSSRVCLVAIGQEAQFEACNILKVLQVLQCEIYPCKSCNPCLEESTTSRMFKHVQTAPAISLLYRPRHMHHWLKGIISTSPHAFAHLLTLTSPGCPVQPPDCHGCHGVLPQHPWHPQTWHCQRWWAGQRFAQMRYQHQHLPADIWDMKKTWHNSDIGNQPTVLSKNISKPRQPFQHWRDLLNVC